MDGSPVTVWMPSPRPHLAHCPAKNTFGDLCEGHLPVQRLLLRTGILLSAASLNADTRL